MTTASDILAQGAGSPTTLIAAGVGSSSTTYTATGPTMINVISGNTTPLLINGVSIGNSVDSKPSQFSYFLGNGQSTTVSCTSGSYLISAQRSA